MKRDIETLGTQSAVRPDRLAPKRWLAAGGVLLLILALIGSMLGYSAAAGNGGGVTLGSYLAGAAALGQLNGTVLVAQTGKNHPGQRVWLRQPSHSYPQWRDARSRPGQRHNQRTPGCRCTSGYASYSRGRFGQYLAYDLHDSATASAATPTTRFTVYQSCPSKWRGVTIADLVGRHFESA